MTEADRLQHRIMKRFVKAFATYRLLDDGDHVLAALSGGKDSLCLLEMLARRSRIEHPRYTVEAAHVRMSDVAYETSADYLQQFCDDLGVTLHIVSTSMNLAPADGQPQKPACFLCSWNRRKQLFNLAQRLGCNKIALGHHQDDLLHTSLMNLFYQGRFDTMPACLTMEKMPLQLIRPLCLVAEADIASYAALRGYQPQVKRCPYEHDTQRTAIGQLFQQLEQMNPEVRYSLWNALERAGKIG